MKSNFDDFDLCPLTVPATLSATTASDPVDLDEYSSCTIVWYLGADAALDGSNYWTLSITECDEVGGTYTDVADAEVDDGTTSPSNSIVVDSTTEDETTYKLGYLGNARFIKANMTETGTVSGPNAMVAVLGRKRMGPMSKAGVAVAS